MQSVTTSHWLALKKRLSTLVTAPAMTAFDPGDVVNPPKDGSNNPLPFILLSDVRNPNRRWGIAASASENSGTFMITVQWPLSRAVTHAQLIEIGGQIAAHFPADLCMSFGGKQIRVERESDVVQPYVDGAYRVVLVRVFWSTT